MPTKLRVIAAIFVFLTGVQCSVIAPPSAYSQDYTTERTITRNFHGQQGGEWEYTVRGKVEDPTIPAAERKALVWRGIYFGADTGPHGVWPNKNSRRWKEPEPFEPKNKGLLGGLASQSYGQTHAQPCAQFRSAFSITDGFSVDELLPIIGSEDCLALDIYAPAETSVSDDAVGGHNLRPVMVWIHGGGNVAGASKEYNGTNLAVSQDVIVVAVQYRVGPFGWFAWPDLHETGDGKTYPTNFGTMDLIASLKWIQYNIETFGGDPNNVTVFGESAGGSNIISLLAAFPDASPTPSDGGVRTGTDGLFHKAIIQSGFQVSVDLATATGLDENGDCSISAPNENRTDACWIVNKLQESGTGVFERDLRMLPMREVLGAYRGNHFPFLNVPRIIEDGHTLPYGDLRDVFHPDRAEFNFVDVIIGSTRDEAKLFLFLDAGLPPTCTASENVCALNADEYNNYTGYVSRLYQIENVENLARNIARSYKNEPPNDTGRAQHDVFMYRFDWDEQGLLSGCDTRFPVISLYRHDLSVILGAAHAMDIPFVFNDFDYFGWMQNCFYTDINKDRREMLARAMSTYWGNFAKDERTDSGAIRGSKPWGRLLGGDGAVNGRQLLLDADPYGSPGEGIEMARLPVRKERNPTPPQDDPRPSFHSVLTVDQLLERLVNEGILGPPVIFGIEHDLIVAAPWEKDKIEKAFECIRNEVSGGLCFD